MFLRRLLKAVKETKQAISKQSEVMQAESERLHERNTPTEVRAEIRFNEQSIRDARAEQDRNFANQRSIKWATWCAFIAASIYAALAAYQLHEMQRATKATRDAADAAASAADTAQRSLKQSIESFRIDERAWVEIGNIDKTVFAPSPPFGTTFKIGIYLKNVGKTVATDVKIHIDNIDDVASFSENEKAIRMFQDQLFREMGTGKKSLTPDKPGPHTLAPGELSAVPVYSGGQEPTKWGENNYRYSFILGRIDYIDAFKTKHWKRLCFFITNSHGEMGHCQYGNDEDENAENPN
jgi:hypothetical protein